MKPAASPRLFRPSRGDVWGGLSAAALVLPQAMAFGITLWAPYTADPAAAALAGLVAAVCLSLASGIAGGTEGQISAPTGPTLVLLSGAVAALAGTGLAGDRLVEAVLTTILLAGCFQFLIGLFRLGHLIKFIPFPVVSGFMTGSGILMIWSQADALSGSGVDLTMAAGAWIPLATAGITMAAMIGMPKIAPQLPGTAWGLVIGTLAFHLFAAFRLEAVPSAWVVGGLPPVSALHGGLSASGLSDLPWAVVVPSALALAVLASLDTLLTSVVADVATGGRHHSRRELMGQGIGHGLSALAGGIAGAGTTGATLVAIESGGRRWAGVMAALTLLVVMFVAAPLAAWLPISVFAGIILQVAIFGMLDRDILLWLRTPTARLDGLIALIVTLVTVFWDLMVAVGLGVVLAVIEFIRSQVQSSVILRRWTGAERMSFRRRSRKACDLLKEHGESIVAYELKGTLFFGTADHLFETIAPDLKQARYIILDLRRVGQVDLTAIRLIEHMCGLMRERGGELILASVPKSMGLVKRKGHRHERLIPYHRNVRVRVFPDADHALEYAENRLLEKLGASEDETRRLDLGETELFQGFSDEELAAIEPFLETVKKRRDASLFRAGDYGDSLFVLLKGSVEILLPYSRGKSVRLARFGPGTVFGEVAFLEPGERTAEARVVRDCECVRLSHEALQKLCASHPQLAMRLLITLGHRLAENLRSADLALRRLIA